MASTFTSAIHLEEPARGDYVNSWDLPANSNFTQIDNAIGGSLTLTLTTGDVTLTQAQANAAIITFIGTLTGDCRIIYPVGAAGRKIFFPTATMGSHTIRVVANAGTDTVGVLFVISFAMPQGVVLTPTRAYWDYGSVGPGSVVGFPVAFANNGWLPCDGSTYGTANFDLLFAVIGYSYGGSGANFKVPDYRGYAPVGSDNMGGPAGNAGRFFNFGPNGTIGELVHVLSVTELAVHNHGVTDPGHTHGASQSPHAHGGVIVPGGIFALGGGGYTNQPGNTDTQQPTVTVNPAVTNISVGPAGSNVGHNNVQPSKTLNLYIRW